MYSAQKHIYFKLIRMVKSKKIDSASYQARFHVIKFDQSTKSSKQPQFMKSVE